MVMFVILKRIFNSTCFNRLDLPLYETKEDLLEKLKLVVTMRATGFDIK